MSLHPSLRQGSNKGKSRTVLKRDERIKKMIEKGTWDKNSKVFGLPKTKIVRMKLVKKEKKQQEEQPVAENGAAAAPTPESPKPTTDKK